MRVRRCAIKELDGERLVTRAELTDRHGVSNGVLQKWFRERAHTGHPDSVGTRDGALVWDSQAWEAWYTARLQALSDHVDRSGDAEDRITLAQAARVLGKEPTSITMYPKRPPVGWPDPVEDEVLPSGRSRRRYRRGDIWAYADRHRPGAHPGGGRPPGTTSTADARRTRRWAYDGDPRLDIARTALRQTPTGQLPGLAARLATEHGNTPGTWAHILTAARQHPTD